MKGFEQLAGLKASLSAQAEADRRAREAARARAARLEREARVFTDAMAGIVPLPPSGRVSRAPQPVPPIALQRALDDAAVLSESLSDEIDIERLLDVDETISYRRIGIGAEVVRKLRRGGWTVKAQLDLHGLRTDEARTALVAFLADMQRREIRCVRIIHGKGLGSVGKEPVLKGKVKKWLTQREDVLAFVQARPNDGGAGALIVLLKAMGAASAG